VIEQQVAVKMAGAVRVDDVAAITTGVHPELIANHVRSHASAPLQRTI